jgi:hypothetical protein
MKSVSGEPTLKVDRLVNFCLYVSSITLLHRKLKIEFTEFPKKEFHHILQYDEYVMKYKDT